MNCDTAQELLLDHVEGELDSAQAVELESHISSCPDCKLALQQTRELLGAVNDIRQKEERASQASANRRSQGAAMELAAWDAGQRLGDFEILGELGRGGMGVVYRARQLSLNRLVALKVLPGIFRQVPTAVTRFKKEAQAAAKLHHTNIVPVYAQGEFEGHFYYAMELVDGDSLDRILKKDPAHVLQNLSTRSVGAMDSQESQLTVGRRGGYRFVARLIAGVAEGLDHAHKQGVIHRDIKPQNILMAPDGQLHITDFGLARLLDEPSITLTGEMVGTPAYMSPEQVTGDRKAIDHRTDIYSLGVTFYEVLTGVRPFEGATREQVVSRILTREPRPPRKLNHHIPVDLETICLRAMEKEPARRYKSAGDMATDLRRYADDRPIFSRRATVIERGVKWVRRHPAMTTISILSAVLIATATLWWVQTVKSRHARANDLVWQAFSVLVHQDYHESRRALDLLRQAAPLGPDEWSYRRALGLAYLDSDQAAAIENLTWAANQRPEDATTLYMLAFALRYQAGRVDTEVRKWLDRADSQGGPRTAESHFFRGMVLVREQEEAEKEFRAAREKREQYAQADLQLGRALNHWMYHHRKHDKFDEQKRCLESAAALQQKAYPRYLLSLAYRLSAEIYESSGNTAEAEKDFGLALFWAGEARKTDSSHFRGYFAEAEYWEYRRNYAKALEFRDLSEPHCKKSKDALRELYQYRWRVLYWLGQYDRAKQDLQAAARVSSQNDVKQAWYAGLFAALMDAEQGKLGDAVRRAHAMAENSPSSFRAVTSAACMLLLLNQVSAAEELLTAYEDRVSYQRDALAEISSDWMRATYRYCQDKVAWAELVALAPSQTDERMAWTIPYFFKAFRELSQNRRDAALEAFRNCEFTFDWDDYSYAARVFVRRMELDPTWPPWLRGTASD